MEDLNAVSIDDVIATSIVDYDTLGAGTEERRNESRNLTEAYHARTEEIKVANDYALGLAKIEVEKAKIEAEKEVRLREAEIHAAQTEIEDKKVKVSKLGIIFGAIGTVLTVIFQIDTARRWQQTKREVMEYEKTGILSSNAKTVVNELKLPTKIKF